MIGTADLLTVNGFTFCKEHGNERCPHCTYDFKDMNNDSILSELDEEIAELLSYDRTFEFNIYQVDPYIKRAAINKIKQEPSYKCSKHDAEDCSTCFDWVELVTREIQQEIKDEKWLKKRQKYLERCD